MLNVCDADAVVPETVLIIDEHLAANFTYFDLDNGFMATRDEMRFPDWERRLRQAEKESTQGNVVSLDAYLQRRGITGVATGTRRRRRS
jgi:hypothetical protein